jgi:hypothetical protein
MDVMGWQSHAWPSTYCILHAAKDIGAVHVHEPGRVLNLVLTVSVTVEVL